MKELDALKDLHLIEKCRDCGKVLDEKSGDPSCPNCIVNFDAKFENLDINMVKRELQLILDSFAMDVSAAFIKDPAA
ncbi:MAG: hypothetical protein ACFFCS_23845, partial [Candidatus Hodarchaeota archaeon]